MTWWDEKNVWCPPLRATAHSSRSSHVIGVMMSVKVCDWKSPVVKRQISVEQWKSGSFLKKKKKNPRTSMHQSSRKSVREAEHSIFPVKSYLCCLKSTNEKAKKVKGGTSEAVELIWSHSRLLSYHENITQDIVWLSPASKNTAAQEQMWLSEKHLHFISFHAMNTRAGRIFGLVDVGNPGMTGLGGEEVGLCEPCPGASRGRWGPAWPQNPGRCSEELPLTRQVQLAPPLLAGNQSVISDFTAEEMLR